MYLDTFVERILDSLQGFAPNIFFEGKIFAHPIVSVLLWHMEKLLDSFSKF